MEKEKNFIANIEETNNKRANENSFDANTQVEEFQYFIFSTLSKMTSYEPENEEYFKHKHWVNTYILFLIGKCRYIKIFDRLHEIFDEGRYMCNSSKWFCHS